MAMLTQCGTDAGDKPRQVMEITSINPESPADMAYREFVIIRYDYTIDHSEGARMWIQPYTNGSISPRFLYSSSDVFYGEGGREVGISISEGSEPVNVDQLRLVMKTPDQSEILYETFINVEFSFNE